MQNTSHHNLFSTRGHVCAHHAPGSWQGGSPASPAQEALFTTPGVSYRSELFISIMSLGQNVKHNVICLVWATTLPLKLLPFSSSALGTIVGHWNFSREHLDTYLYRGDWPGVSPACSESSDLWWENSLFGIEHTFSYRLDSCSFQASELWFDCRSEEEILFSIHVHMSLHTCILVPLQPSHLSQGHQAWHQLDS